MDRELNIPFVPLKCYAPVDIFKILREMGLNCTMVDRAKTNFHWHFLAACWQGSPDPNVYVFLECVNFTILYIAIDGRTAMFRRYDSIFHARDEQPSFRPFITEAFEAMHEAIKCLMKGQARDSQSNN